MFVALAFVMALSGGVGVGWGRGGSIYRGLEQNDIEVCVSWIEDTEEKKRKNRDIYG